MAKEINLTSPSLVDKFVWIDDELEGFILLNLTDVDCVSLSFSKTTRLYTVKVTFKNQHEENYSYTVYATAKKIMLDIKAALLQNQMLI